MIGHDTKPAASLADQVDANLAGQAEARLALARVQQDVAHPDAFHVSAMKVWATHGSAGLLGWHRTVQKALERVGER